MIYARKPLPKRTVKDHSELISQQEAFVKGPRLPTCMPHRPLSLTGEPQLYYFFYKLFKSPV